MAFYTDTLSAAGWNGTFNSPGAGPFISSTQTSSTTQSSSTGAATGQSVRTPPRVGNFIGVDANGATILFIQVTSVAPSGASGGATQQTYVETIEERSPNATSSPAG